jgi:hypothetical protein
MEMFDAARSAAQQLLHADAYQKYSDALDGSITARLLEARTTAEN